MGYPTDRVILFDRDMEPLGELPPDEVRSRSRHEEVNGQHELTIVTTRRLEEGWRALTVDGKGKWFEWVVVETPEEHSDGSGAVGTYHLVWSLQYDLTHSYSHSHAEIGYGAMPKTAQGAAAVILEDVPRWEVGPCDGAAITEGGCVFIYESAWSRLSKAVELTGWEVDAVIQVSNVFDVTARQLCLKAHVGSETATRRFDWGHDVTSIKRTPDPGPYYCRVVPLGKGETEYAEDDETTFEWPLDITEEEPSGNYYIQDNDAALAFRIADGEGGWIYPTKAVSYSEDDPELLYNAAMDDLHNHTRPGVTYEANVVQFAKAGMDAQGVSLGDEIQCVDRGFNPGSALRLQGRVISMDVDELSPETGTELTIGNLRGNMADELMRLSEELLGVGYSLDDLESKHSAIRQSIADMSTARYIDELLDRINTEINATGGYAYFVPGEGVVTYDTSVSDPLVGSEATKVVQIKGGSIRIADAKQAGFSGIDDWVWKTVFTSGHILSDLVTAVKVTAGYIGNATNGNYWNLDTGELVLRMLLAANRLLVTKHGEITTTDSDLYWDITGGTLPTGATRSIYGFKVSEENPQDNTESSYILLVPHGSLYHSSSSYYWNSIVSKHSLSIIASADDNNGKSVIHMGPNFISLMPDGEVAYGGSGSSVGLRSTPTKLSIGPLTGTSSSEYYSYDTTNKHVFKGDVTIQSALSVNDFAYFAYQTLHGGNAYFPSGVYCGNVGSYPSDCDANLYADDGRFNGNLNVYGTKSRVADTEDYGGRRLYAYETPTPEFGDLGSGKIDEDGFCYVAIDDIFAETADVSSAYQVFLQKCGRGDLWVEEKHATHFVVRGTPNLAFDWEVKARQAGYETIRLEPDAIVSAEDGERRDASDMAHDVEGSYDGDLDFEEPDYSDDFIDEMERLYEEELMAS